MLRKIVQEPIIREKLEETGVPGIVDLNITEAGCSFYHVVVSIHRLYPGHAREVITALWGVGRSLFRQIIVVDDDINPRDRDEVEWAVATRCRPDKDIIIIPEHITTVLDPAMPPEEQRAARTGITAKYAIDATKSHAYSDIALPDQKYLDAVRARWSEYGIKRLTLNSGRK